MHIELLSVPVTVQILKIFIAYFPAFYVILIIVIVVPDFPFLVPILFSFFIFVVSFVFLVLRGISEINIRMTFFCYIQINLFGFLIQESTILTIIVVSVESV